MSPKPTLTSKKNQITKFNEPSLTSESLLL